MANAKYWVGVLYPENMRPDWQDVIGDLVGVPYAYCIHDKDHLAEYDASKSADEEERKRLEERKTHVHAMLCFSNTTTYKHAFEIFNKLSADGKKALNKIEGCSSVRGSYEYLIHNTETAKKQKKYQYPAAERVTGNNFDIGSFEQVSRHDKLLLIRDLGNVIREQSFQDFGQFYDYVVGTGDLELLDCVVSHSGLFERLTKSNYMQVQRERQENNDGFVGVALSGMTTPFDDEEE